MNEGVRHETSSWNVYDKVRTRDVLGAVAIFAGAMELLYPTNWVSVAVGVVGVVGGNVAIFSGTQQNESGQQG
jgi:hypothetical protein